MNIDVGDLVRHCSNTVEGHLKAGGIVVDVIQKKVWRAGDMGKKVNWDIVDPEPHAVVLFPWNDGTINIPFAELEVVAQGGDS